MTVTKNMGGRLVIQGSLIFNVHRSNHTQKACKILKNFKQLDTVPAHPEQGHSTQPNTCIANALLKLADSRGITETGIHTSCMGRTESWS